MYPGTGSDPLRSVADSSGAVAPAALPGGAAEPDAVEPRAAG